VAGPLSRRDARRRECVVCVAALLAAALFAAVLFAAVLFAAVLLAAVLFVIYLQASSPVRGRARRISHND
jgi:4-hydroxybenzoate polyprenyltransferase